jgi:acetolactate decarboxylase
VWQVSTSALLAGGAFRGEVTAAQALHYGNMGVGAADRLEGELAVVGGKFYQYLENGRIEEPDPSLRLPFAIMTQWRGGTRLHLDDGQQYDSARLAAVDRLLPTTDAFYALVVTGTWSKVHARTFRCQNPPYGPVTPAMEDTFTLRNVTGTMVGFREPPYVGTLSVANYHFHFVSSGLAGGERGGHVLGFTAGPDVWLEYSRRPYFTVYIPPPPSTAPPPPPCRRASTGL